MISSRQVAEYQPSRQVPTRRQTEPRSTSTALPRRLLARRLLARRPATRRRRRLAHNRARLPIPLFSKLRISLSPTPIHRFFTAASPLTSYRHPAASCPAAVRLPTRTA